MRTLSRLVPMLLFVIPAVAPAQSNPPAAAAPAAAEANPWSGFTKMGYAKLEEWLLRSAERMPEESYGFRPVESVRTFGQIVGHVADAQYLFCSSVLGEPNPAPKIEKTKTSKAELVTALKDAFAYCDRAYAPMTDAAGAQTVKHGMWGEMPKLSLLTANAMHCTEHYGNIVTYLRMKGLVPPSSEPGGMQPKK